MIVVCPVDCSGNMSKPCIARSMIDRGERRLLIPLSPPYIILLLGVVMHLLANSLGRAECWQAFLDSPVLSQSCKGPSSHLHKHLETAHQDKAQL